MDAAPGQGVHRGGVADEGRDGEPPAADDVSGGLFTAQGVHDDVAARDVCADMAKANVLVGIYFDAGGSSYNAGSVTGYDTDRPFSAQNLRLATLVQNDVLGAMNAQGWGIPNLGVVDDSQLGGPALTTAAGTTATSCCSGPADPGWFTHAEHDAGRADRAAVHHRSLRGEHRGRARRASR